MAQRNGHEALARAVMELIDQGHRRMSRYVDLTRLRILGTVASLEPVRPSTISAELGLTASATSRHLAALERAGHVTVEPDPQDSRTFLVRPTDAGRADSDATIRAGAAVFADVIADWSDVDLATALDVITRLNQGWARYGEAARTADQPGTGPRWLRARRAARSGEGKDRL